MISVMCPGIAGVKPAAPGIMTGDPAAPAMAVVPRHPHPVIPFVPVTAAMIIRPVTNGDGKAERL